MLLSLQVDVRDETADGDELQGVPDQLPEVLEHSQADGVTETGHLFDLDQEVHDPDKPELVVEADQQPHGGILLEDIDLGQEEDIPHFQVDINKYNQFYNSLSYSSLNVLLRTVEEVMKRAVNLIFLLCKFLF